MFGMRGNTSLYSLVLAVTFSLPFAGVIGAPPKSKTAKAPRTGEQIYRLKCASCHGAKGEGTKFYQKPLAGQQSVVQLTRFIGQSMPPGPKPCGTEESKRVAGYIYDAFYSPIAQSRNRPARVELARLTVRQYQNALTDLIGSFREIKPMETPKGLRAEYFKSRNFSNGERVIDKVDSTVNFDFGTEAPATEKPDQIDKRLFSILWSGSVLSPDTGEYEFVIKTEHAVRLWVNDVRRPLIDATVKSGKDTEYHATLALLGGRAYPIRLEFSKSKQGVDDSDKTKKLPSVHASVSLEWKPPKRRQEVIPSRCLIPSAMPTLFVATAPFPPDDRSLGYERGTAISKAWDEATTEGALETAHYVIDHLKEFSGIADSAPDRAKQLGDFCRKLAERAFRRPLTADVSTFYVDRFFKSGKDLDESLKRSLLLILKSPRFLYREVGITGSDAYTVASRLSFGLWDTMPDGELLKAAAKGELVTREQVQHQAERMVADPRVWFKLREFLMQWLRVEQYPDLAKDTKTYPDFSLEVQADLRAAMEVFLEKVAWGERADFRELLLTDKLYLNGRLAKLYGVNLPEEAPFQPVELDANERAGVLTHPYLMASFAYLKGSSPIHRGVLIARNLLGRTLLPPPIAVAPTAADLHPNMTTRQRVSLQTKPAACMSCHSMINALGFPFEKFDAMGRIRTEENKQPIDTTGGYRSRTGQQVRFANARELATFLANSGETHAAFVEKLFQFFIKQPIRAYGPQTATGLQRTFVTNEFNIRKELIEIVVTSALKG